MCVCVCVIRTINKYMKIILSSMKIIFKKYNSINYIYLSHNSKRMVFFKEL